MAERNNGQEKLRREGLTTYFDALIAIDEFTRLIQADCRKVLERYAAALGDATAMKFSTKEMSDYSEPYNGRGKAWAGQYAAIGSILPVVKSDKFYCMDAGITWEQEDGPQSPYFYSCFYTKNLGPLDQLYSRLRPDAGGKLEVDKSDYALVLWGDSAIGPDGEYRLDALEDVVLKWVELWKRADGSSKIF